MHVRIEITWVVRGGVGSLSVRRRVPQLRYTPLVEKGLWKPEDIKTSLSEGTRRKEWKEQRALRQEWPRV